MDLSGDGRDVDMDSEALDLWASRKWGWGRGPELLKEAKEEVAGKLLLEDVQSRYEERKAELGEEALRGLERFLVLNAIDTKWKDHLYTMDSLRQGIGLRSYAQVDPKNEYKREGLERFQELLGDHCGSVRSVFRPPSAPNCGRNAVMRANSGVANSGGQAFRLLRHPG